MLAIKKVTIAAAFVAAPIALWGCSSKDDSPQTGGDGDGTDDNGAAPDALAAEKAIRGKLLILFIWHFISSEKSKMFKRQVKF